MYTSDKIFRLTEALESIIGRSMEYFNNKNRFAGVFWHPVWPWQMKLWFWLTDVQEPSIQKENKFILINLQFEWTARYNIFNLNTKTPIENNKIALRKFNMNCFYLSLDNFFFIWEWWNFMKLKFNFERKPRFRRGKRSFRCYWPIFR